jgi:carboxymethylenebutenolidase
MNTFAQIFFFAIFTTLFGVKIDPAPQQNPLDMDMVMCYAQAKEMADFAADPEFQALHPAPLPLDYAEMGQNISFPASDGVEAKGYLVKAAKKSNKWLFVYQEWWGLNENIRREADQFYKDLGGKVNVLALDMYDGQVATTPQDAGKIMQSVKEPRLENIVKAGLTLAGKKAKVASVGWCFGGSWSLKSALLSGKQAVGSIIYYGMPVREVEKLKTLNCDVLGIFATEERISKVVIEDFAAKMKEAGKSVDYKIYPGVHGFANPSNPKHDPEATKEAYGKSLAYLKDKFGM